MTEQSLRPPAAELVAEPETLVMTDALVPVDAPAEAELPPAPVEATSTDTPDGDVHESADAASLEPEAATPAKKRIPPQAVVAQLMAAWPQAFFAEPRSVKPLAIGTLQQILTNRPAALEGLNSQAIRSGIKFYTSRLSYHYGIVHNSHRITLSGEAADEVDEKAREFAKTQILAIQQQRAERRAAQNPTAADGVVEATGEERKVSPSSQGRRAKRERTTSQPQPVPTDASADEAAPRRDRADGGRPENASRNRRPRRDQAQRPARPAVTDAQKSSNTESARANPPQENLTLEEKLARLAQHFGKSG